jgi:predicted SprT family Zn-dependent metalloprotease
MNLNQAQTLANELMVQHGISQLGWKFKFDNALKRFGVCRYRSKVIGLSRHLTALNSLELVKDTILHEIAHAIAGYNAKHGVEWKLVCIRIGAKPQRCYSNDDTNTPTLKYQAVCGGCNTLHQKARIKLKNVRRACMCQSHKPWSEKILLEFKQNY